MPENPETKFPKFMLGFIFLYFCWATHVGKILKLTFIVSWSWEQVDFYSHVWLRIIVDNYVRIMFIYHTFVD